ncbi:MAG TPA: precorrin-6y C5,15-methyltransferase (decarboxylating) subunit CbiE [Acidimicrobiales bacterium]|nr:precorrin-6y C5,15-methyltransferase (decarboxylating) subunit CbiE [Acidimicrobiales bacterium]
MPDPAQPVDIVGVHGGCWFGPAAGRAVEQADVVIASARHLESVAVAPGCPSEEMGPDVHAALDRVAAWRAGGRRVCVLASGDPGFFGIVRLAALRFGAGGLRIHPAPSSVSLAFARAGLHWDDSAVVSAHGRHPAAAADAVARAPKVAVLCSPDCPPATVGRLALSAGSGRRDVTVASRLGEPDEALWHGSLEDLAAGTFDALSVVVCRAPERPAAAGLAWGRPEAGFAHRDGMITKAEVRAVALGKLDLPAAGVLWDVGAGSGSVSAECAFLAPGLRIYAVEQRESDIEMLAANLDGTAAVVVAGAAPAALRDLPDPDRVFVGGGGLAVLDEVLRRTRPGGTVVASYAAPARAVEAARRLGNMVQVSISRAVPAGSDGTVRLAAENPVFVCWGPAPA